MASPGFGLVAYAFGRHPGAALTRIQPSVRTTWRPTDFPTHGGPVRLPGPAAGTAGGGGTDAERTVAAERNRWSASCHHEEPAPPPPHSDVHGAARSSAAPAFADSPGDASPVRPPGASAPVGARAAAVVVIGTFSGRDRIVSMKPDGRPVLRADVPGSSIQSKGPRAVTFMPISRVMGAIGPSPSTITPARRRLPSRGVGAKRRPLLGVERRARGCRGLARSAGPSWGGWRRSRGHGAGERRARPLRK